MQQDQCEIPAFQQQEDGKRIPSLSGVNLPGMSTMATESNPFSSSLASCFSTRWQVKRSVA